eukprot:Hpha_TRINITY_DN16453_c1_g16::TRINITY_DN16453_c1_g16_i1::g.161262::m.161262
MPLPWVYSTADEVRHYATLGDRREFLTFSTRAADLEPFGVKHNDRVRFTKGSWTGRRATVLGVHQCCLWVLLDGDEDVRDLRHCHNHTHVERLYGMVLAQDSPNPNARTNSRSPWNDHSVSFVGVRAGVFWCNDGVLSVASLLTALAVLYSGSQVPLIGGVLMVFGGAATVASAEWVSSSVESELTAWELETEKAHLREHPEDEARNLNQLLSEFFSEQTNRLIHRDTQGREKIDTQLNLHAKLEFGVDLRKDSQGRIRGAMTAFACFAAGGLIPLLPWFAVWEGVQTKVAAMLLLVFSFDLTAATWGASAGSSPAWFAVIRQVGVTACCVTASLLVSLLARRLHLL